MTDTKVTPSIDNFVVLPQKLESNDISKDGRDKDIGLVSRDGHRRMNDRALVHGNI